MEDEVERIEAALGLQYTADAPDASRQVTQTTTPSPPQHRNAARNYVITLFHFDALIEMLATQSLPHITKLVRGEERTYIVSFLYGQFESAPDTKRAHFQGYVQFKTKGRYFEILQELFGACHVEVARGSVKSCIDYCSKEETRLAGPFELGNVCTIGQRSDLLGFREAIKSGTTDYDLWHSEHFPTMLKYYRSMSILRSVFNPPQHESKRELSEFCIPPLEWDGKSCWLLCGPTNIGKTHFALAHFKHPLFVRHLDKLSDLNSTHDGIVFDDISFTMEPFDRILNVIDTELECQVHIRYTIVVLRARLPRIFTHQSEDIFDSYKCSVEQKAAIARRVKIRKVVKCFNISELSVFADIPNLVPGIGP